jgi:DNA repair protein RadC
MKRIAVYGLILVRDSSVAVESRAADSPAVAADILRKHIGPVDREHLVVLLVDSRHRVVGINTVSIGTASASLVHPREVLKPAVLVGAAAFIIGHNHPSGDEQPSAEDKEATRRLARAGELMGIPLLDHVIIGNGFFSFRESGLL